MPEPTTEPEVTEQHTSRRWKLWLWPMVVGLLLAVFQWATWPKVTPSGKDSNLYIEGAKSLATSGTYRHALHVGTPPLLLYPPGQSAYLSLFWRFSGQDYPEGYPYLACGIWIAGLSAVGLLMLYLHRTGVGPFATALGGALLGLSPMWLSYEHFLWSEAAYCALAGAAFLTLRQAIEQPRVRTWVYLGCVIAALLAWRTAAVAFVVGGLAAALVFGGRSRGRAALAILIPVIAWVLLFKFARPSAQGWDGGTYAYGWRDKWESIGGAHGYARLLYQHGTDLVTGQPFVDGWFGTVSRLASPQVSPPNQARVLSVLEKVLGLGVFALAAVGLLSRPSKTELGVALVVGAVVSENLLWIWDVGGRLYLPITAPVMAWMVTGWRTLAPAAVRPFFRFATLAGAVTMLAADVWYVRQFGPFAEAQATAFRRFVRETVPPGLHDGELAVDIELPVPLVVRELGVRVANIPRADEYGTVWIPIASNPPPAPRYFLARTRLFDETSARSTVHGKYRIQQRSPNGVHCLAVLEAPASTAPRTAASTSTTTVP